ncbi:hypothetical protein Ocin01_17373 [Orchesella cincta]|uniref:Uncharacterized protein n=1 Tax=Orchesella cincta TaxID=48709 RepID=A0A1D2M8P4_ORCCI|nr:hypothetical protein Ocin01_17373 [Orchesella cincta]
MEHSFDYSQEYDDSFAIVSTSNIGAASGSGARSTDPDACNQSIIVDNDCFITLINTDDYYRDMYRKRKNTFDMSDFDKDHKIWGKFHCPNNRKRLGFMKDEAANKVITHFCVARPKMYTYRYLEDGEERVAGQASLVQRDVKKGKGISTTALEKRITFDQYQQALDGPVNFSVEMRRIVSKKHDVFTVKEHKKGLSGFDVKRYIFHDSVQTLAFGHCSFNETTGGEVETQISDIDMEAQISDTEMEAQFSDTELPPPPTKYSPSSSKFRAPPLVNEITRFVGNKLYSPPPPPSLVKEITRFVGNKLYSPPPPPPPANFVRNKSPPPPSPARLVENKLYSPPPARFLGNKSPPPPQEITRFVGNKLYTPPPPPPPARFLGNKSPPQSNKFPPPPQEITRFLGNKSPHHLLRKIPKHW